MSKRQSLGTATRRDDRRKGAIARLEANVAFYKKSIDSVKAGRELVMPDGTKLNKEEGLKRQTRKLLLAEEALANTQKNMGKGTRALQG